MCTRVDAVLVDASQVDRWLALSDSASGLAFEDVLGKARTAQGLSPEEAAILLGARDDERVAALLTCAAEVKQRIYGNRVVLFAPLYIGNTCVNRCAYCAFSAGNSALRRTRLDRPRLENEVRTLLRRGHKRLLVVAGEDDGNTDGVAHGEAIEAIYSVRERDHSIRRANLNCAPLTVEGYRRVKAVGIGTYQLFQETYHEATYRSVHTAGPKTDFHNRLDAIDRAIEAGIDDVGIGVLYGLYDHRWDTLALLGHVAELERRYGFGPHTISVPRLEPAEGITFETPYALSDRDFKKVVAVLRLAVPYTGIILSTRERAELRDELFSLGISQASAASSTTPGGYAESDDAGQFSVGDHRSLDEVVGALLDAGTTPSFCTACYRACRTGERFMNLARPGTISGMCSVNALVTLKEYLDDFATPAVRRRGYQLIERMRGELDANMQAELSRFFADVDAGLRDRFL